MVTTDELVEALERREKGGPEVHEPFVDMSTIIKPGELG